MKSDKKLLVSLIVLACLLLVVTVFFGIASQNVKVITEKVYVNNTIVEYEAPVIPEFILSESEFEDKAIEAQALIFAQESVDSRDFKKAVFDALEAYGEDIEDYKDITEFSIVDIDVDGNEVSFDVKVYYFIDGDEDEAYKARLNEFTVEVDELDFDDNFVDATINEDYLDSLSVKKVYEL